MPNNDYYAKGQWNVICDVCGFKFKSSKIRKRWDGLMVCHDDWETNHPQKFLRVKEDKIAPPWTRPDPPITYKVVCYVYESASYADLATADCGRADIADPSYAFLLGVKTESLG